MRSAQMKGSASSKVVAINPNAKRPINIDEKTMREIMGYLKTEDHDLFAGYVKTLGIEHTD